MTRERGQEEAAGDEAHACRAASTGAPARDRRACGEAHDGPDTIGAILARAPRACGEAHDGPDTIGAILARAPRACGEAHDGPDTIGAIQARTPRACRVARPAPSPRHRGRVTVVGTGPGGSGVVAAQRGYDGALRPLVGAGLGGSAGVVAARRGDDTPLRHTVGDKRWATLRRVVASQTETAGPAPLSAHGRRAEEGAR
ncbi:DUF6380 family protein [Streptomyces violaceus]